MVTTLQSAGHTVSVVLPHIQRSWVGKAHLIGQTLTPSYFRPGTLHEDNGVISTTPDKDGEEEWTLIDGTPASCVQIGLAHLFQDRGPVDLVLSGPNYGRNSTAVFSLSSGTIGGAMEGAVCGKKAIALSYAFDSRVHEPEIIAAASDVSRRLIEKLVREWPEPPTDIHLYSINVPLRTGVESTKIMYTKILQNRWTSASAFEQIEVDVDIDGNPVKHRKELSEGDDNLTNGMQEIRSVTPAKLKQYKWAPVIKEVYDSVTQAGPGSDGWALTEGTIR